MFSNKIIYEIIENELKNIYFLKKHPSKNTILIDNQNIDLNLYFSTDINILEVAKHLQKKIVYKLIDITNDKKYKVNINILI